VRLLVKQKQWCKEVYVIERDINLGLANSVIQGVTEVIGECGRVIVLEDDIITGTYFLQFMNDGLNLYKDERKVFGVSGYQFTSSKKVNEATYFLPIMSSWGYGTWLDRWQDIEFDSKKLLEIVDTKNIGTQLDFGSIKYYQMLKQQVNGEIDSWAVRFYVSMFLKQGVFLYPNKNLIQNVGLDGSGVHCKQINLINDDATEISKELVPVHKKPIQIKNKIVDRFRNSIKANKKDILKSNILKIISPEIKSLIKRKLNKSTLKTQTKFDTLKLVPRYTKTSTVIDGYTLIIPDSASFLFMYNEIFKSEIYKFNTENRTPYIIDGGANIGLASIYFKKLYPNAEIVAFEPDPSIYDILEKNINSYAFEAIKLIKKGLWDEEATLKFQSEGADAGLLGTFDKTENNSTYDVSVTSLKPFLQKRVDFLKLDIEGAETVVLKDIAKDLDKVERIFIEYHSFVNQEQTLNEIIEILKQANFRLYVSSPGITSKSPFININVYRGMDMQLNIYGVKTT
jgi:FkbM family methyltransferase